MKKTVTVPKTVLHKLHVWMQEKLEIKISITNCTLLINNIKVSRLTYTGYMWKDFLGFVRMIQLIR